jgi:hypothetical protein
VKYIPPNLTPEQVELAYTQGLIDQTHRDFALEALAKLSKGGLITAGDQWILEDVARQVLN